MDDVRCLDCKYFIPDNVGDGSGIGQCQKLEDYRKLGVSHQAIEKADKQLGKMSKWPKALRNCAKYEVKNDE